MKTYKLEKENRVFIKYTSKYARSGNGYKNIIIYDIKNKNILGFRLFLFLLNDILLSNDKRAKDFFNRGNFVWVYDFIDFYQPLLIRHFVNFIKLNKRVKIENI